MRTSLSRAPVLRERSPAPVTPLQWVLAALSLAIAGLSYLSPSYESLGFWAGALTIVGLGLALSALREALRTRLLGKLFLFVALLVFFWFEALFLATRSVPFAVPPGLPILSAQFSLGIIQQAYLYITFFQLALLVGYSIRFPFRRTRHWIWSRVDSLTTSTRILRYLFAACILVPLLVSLRFNISSVIEALIRSRSDPVLIESTALLIYVSYFGLFGAAFLLVDAVIFRSVKRLPPALFAGLVIVPVLALGTRHLILYLVLPMLVIGLYRIQGKISGSGIIRWGIVALLLLAALQVQQRVRGVGWNNIGSITASELLRAPVTEQFTALLLAEDLIPNTHDYFMEFVTPYFITHWIPRGLWPDKPTIRSWSYFNDAWTQGYEGFNVTPSVIGQYHINWGPFGVLFIGIWLGFLTYLADLSLLSIEVDRQRAMAVVIGMLYAFIVSSFRIYAPYYFAYLAVGILGMLLLTRSRRMPSTAPDPNLRGRSDVVQHGRVYQSVGP